MRFGIWVIRTKSAIPDPKSQIQFYGFNFPGTFLTSFTPFFTASAVLSAADLVTSTVLFAAFLVSSTTLSVVLFAALPTLFISFPTVLVFEPVLVAPFAAVGLEVVVPGAEVVLEAVFEALAAALVFARAAALFALFAAGWLQEMAIRETDKNKKTRWMRFICMIELLLESANDPMFIALLAQTNIVDAGSLF